MAWTWMKPDLLSDAGWFDVVSSIIVFYNLIIPPSRNVLDCLPEFWRSSVVWLLNV